MNYEVRPIPYVPCRNFVIEHHYSRGMPNTAVACYGLFEKRWLIGVLAFATPCSEAVRGSVFGPAYVDRVTELSRLVILDVTPKNAESFFIAKCLAQLKRDKPHLWAVVTFADPSAGHVGVIYQATNSLYYGQSKPETFYIDAAGRLRHRRQCGHNVSLAEAHSLGWSPVRRQGKHRYCFTIPDSRIHRREIRERIRLEPHQYPKHAVTKNGIALEGRGA